MANQSADAPSGPSPGAGTEAAPAASPSNKDPTSTPTADAESAALASRASGAVTAPEIVSGPVNPIAPTVPVPVGGATASGGSGGGVVLATAPSMNSGGIRRRSAPELTVGMILAERYQVLERLSAGGMGVVYKARHIALDDLVALKLLLKPQKEEDQKRFLLEARVATKIKHPNTVYISDFGVMADGRSYLAMEFLQGQTLAQAIKKLQDTGSQPNQSNTPTVTPTGPSGPIVPSGASGPGSGRTAGGAHSGPGPGGAANHAAAVGMDPVRACRIAVQIARGLQAVHDKGIIHRDLKPENIFLLDQEWQDGSRDFVKIVDFGIAKVTHVAANDKSTPQNMPTREQVLQAAQAAGGSSGNQQSVTLPGSVMGTPAYMSPEAIDGKHIDFRADQYSFGCLLYEMLSGQTPFRSRSTAGMLMKHLADPVPHLRTEPTLAALPPSLEALVLRMLSKQPQERFGSMREIEQALTRELDLMLVLRGEKTVLPTALAGAIIGKGLGAALILGKRRVPLLALLPVALLLLGSSALVTYRLALKPHKPTLAPGELATLRQQAIATLKKDLDDPNNPPPLRVLALAALGQSQDSTLRPTLETALKPGAVPAAPELRAQAAESLGQLGDRGAVPTLLPLLDDESAPVLAVFSAIALRQLGEPRGHETIEKLLDSKQPEAQFRAALALCEQGPDKARTLLRELLKRSGVPETARLDMQSCLARAGDDAAKSALRTQMQTPGPAQPKTLAAGRLAQLGDAAAKSYLLDLVRKKDTEQLPAARLLASPDTPDLRELFRQVVDQSDASPSARQLGTEGLGAIGELFDARLLGTLLKPAVPTELRDSAAAAILQIAAHDPSAWSARSLAWARGALSDRDWLVREAAAAVLGDSVSADAVTLLSQLLKDADARVRRSAARALGRRSEKSALRALVPALEDSDASVRGEALRAIGRLLQTLVRLNGRGALGEAAGELGPILHRIIEKGSLTERLLAFGLLGRLGDRSQLERLLDFKDTPEPEVRRLFIEQLEGHIELLVEALADKDFSVRLAAARALAERGDKRAVPVLREALAHGGAAAIIAYGLLAQLGEAVPSVEELLALFDKTTGAERIAAVEAALRLPLGQALALLQVAVRDGRAGVRKAAAEVAAELPLRDGKPAGLGLLELLLTDPDPAVRARAQALLAALQKPSASAGKESAEVEPPPANEAARPDGGAATATPPSANGKPASSGEPGEATPSGPDAAADLDGMGLLTIKGPDFIQYQLDGKHWQFLTGKPHKLPPGAHRLVTMSGKQELVIEERKTKAIELAPSPIEDAAHNGIEAYNRKDYGKAAKLLERAYQRCERAHGLAQPCENLTAELAFYLGRTQEAQGRTEEAATSYQQVIDAKLHGRLNEKQREIASTSLRTLAQSLGLVIMRDLENGQCVDKKKWWLPPGSHTLKHNGERQEVKVKARQTLLVGPCK